MDRVANCLDEWERSNFFLPNLLEYKCTSLFCLTAQDPFKCYESIERIMWDLLREGSWEGRSNHLVAWQKVCLHDEEGDLAPWNSVCWNIYLVCKWLLVFNPETSLFGVKWSRASLGCIKIGGMHDLLVPFPKGDHRNSSTLLPFVLFLVDSYSSYLGVPYWEWGWMDFVSYITLVSP